MTTSVPVHWWNMHIGFCNNKEMWDQWYIDNVLLKDTEHVQFKEVERDDFNGGILIIAGRFHNSAEDIEILRRYVSLRSDLVIIVTSDEENSLDIKQLPIVGSSKIWVMTPSVDIDYPANTRFIGSLVTKHMDRTPKNKPVNNFYFAGQVTHAARERLIEQLSLRTDGAMTVTKGFTQGVKPQLYAESMTAAKIIPCPPGAQKPDSFRFYEALEVGALPILDINDKKYWHKMFGKLPPVIYTNGWENVNAAIDRSLPNWLDLANHSYSWWKREKWRMKQWLYGDLSAIGYHVQQSDISFLVSVSPIAAHPDPSILITTVDSILERSPDSPIYLMFDGVREEQIGYRSQYREHIRKVLIHYRDVPNILPVAMKHHQHQAVMTRRVIRMVNTALICFVEQDTPLIGPYDWPTIFKPFRDDNLDMLRFHHEHEILPPHEHLMIDHYAQQDLPYRRTVQWSQRPHLAKTEWYREMLDTYFGWKSRTMIEDVMYGVVQEAWHREGMEGWAKFRIGVYTPKDGINIKRSTHLDGRGEDPKYDMKIRFDGEAPEYARPPR